MNVQHVGFGNRDPFPLSRKCLPPCLLRQGAYLFEPALPTFFVPGAGVYCQKWDLLDGLNRAGSECIGHFEKWRKYQ